MTGGPSVGTDVKMVKRALGKFEDSLLPPKPGGYDRIYNDRTAEAVDVFRRSIPSLIDRRGKPFGQPDLDELDFYFDAYGRWRYRMYVPPKPPKPKPAVPNLGPVYVGGQSILHHDLTHETDGLPGYPAFDDGWVAGRQVIAPEDMVITRIGSAQGGSSVYATGRSLMRYWFGHVALPSPLGPVKKGRAFAVISSHESPPHVHVGIDAKPLIGHELIHHTDYSHGAPTVGAQLTKALRG